MFQRDAMTIPARCIRSALLLWVSLVAGSCRQAPEPAVLPSWSEGPVKERILGFIHDVTDPSSARYVPPRDRIAVFDLDGTLVIEKPIHMEVLVAMEALRAAARAEPSLAEEEPYRSIVAGDRDYLRRHGAEIVSAAVSGSIKDFRRAVRTILRREHPSLERPYSALFFRPMVELIGLLQAKAFAVYVVSQSQQEYIRAFAEPCLGIEPTHVIGSMYAFVIDGDDFVRTGTQWEPYNRGEGKVLRIRDDAARELEYRNESMLELARQRSWEIVSMKRDFAVMFGENCSLPE
jgi:phosphoserine phosphatase